MNDAEQPIAAERLVVEAVERERRDRLTVEQRWLSNWTPEKTYGAIRRSARRRS